MAEVVFGQGVRYCYWCRLSWVKMDGTVYRHGDVVVLKNFLLLVWLKMWLF